MAGLLLPGEIKTRTSEEFHRKRNWVSASRPSRRHGAMRAEDAARFVGAASLSVRPSTLARKEDERVRERERGAKDAMLRRERTEEGRIPGRNLTHG